VIANLGYIAYARGKIEEAETLLRRAVKLDEKHFPAHYDLGRLLVSRKRYEEAVQALRRAGALNSTDPGIHYQLFISLSPEEEAGSGTRVGAVQATGGKAQEPRRPGGRRRTRRAVRFAPAYVRGGRPGGLSQSPTSFCASALR